MTAKIRRPRTQDKPLSMKVKKEEQTANERGDGLDKERRGGGR